MNYSSKLLVLVFFVVVLLIAYGIHYFKVRKLRKDLSNLKAGQSGVYLDPGFGSGFDDSLPIYVHRNDEYRFNIRKGDLVRFEKGDSIRLFMNNKPLSSLYADIEGLYVVKHKVDRRKKMIMVILIIIAFISIFWDHFFPEEFWLGDSLIAFSLAMSAYFYIRYYYIKEVELHKVG